MPVKQLSFDRVDAGAASGSGCTGGPGSNKGLKTAKYIVNHDAQHQRLMKLLFEAGVDEKPPAVDTLTPIKKRCRRSHLALEMSSSIKTSSAAAAAVTSSTSHDAQRKCASASCQSCYGTL